MLYVQGDLVLIRCTNVRNKVARKNYVTKGKIIACNYNLHRYKVRFVHPNVNRSLRSTKWVPVSNITSLTRAEEKKRRKSTLADIQQANARKKYYLPYEHEDRIDIFESQGFEVQLDPTPDGNCQCEAVVDQLRGIGIFRSIASLRSEIVGDLANRSTTSDGSSLDSFVENNDLTTYLNDMAKLGTYGDHITLQRAAALYRIQIVALQYLASGPWEHG